MMQWLLERGNKDQAGFDYMLERSRTTAFLRWSPTSAWTRPSTWTA